MICEIFGNDYKVPRNWRFDIDSHYPEKRKILKRNGTQLKFFTAYFECKFEDLMKNNNLELITVVNNIKLKYNVIDDITKVEESFDIDSIYNKIFKNCRNNFIITNGNNVLCYNKTNNKLKIYHRQNSVKILTYNNNFIKKFNKL